MKKLLVLLFICSTVAIKAQSKKKDNTPKEYNEQEFVALLLKEYNTFRANHGIDSADVMPQLVTAAELSSADMAKAEKANFNNSSETTPKYLKKVGCTDKGSQYVISVQLGKGNNYNDAPKLVKLASAKWATGKKEKAVLLDPSYVYVGISAKPDKANKKIYISIMLGNFQSFNGGVKMKKELSVPFNTKSKKLKDRDPKKCKNCDKFKDFDRLRDSIYVENGKIYLKYDNLKYLKKLFKKPTDGLAVDIVQKDQYSKAEYNIMDNRLRNKGVMQKVIYKDKLFSKNLIKPDPKAKKKQKINKLLVEVGKFPKGITGPYELNLMIIQDKYVCKTVLRSYTEQGDQESSTPLEMLPLPESMAARYPPFEPRSESTILNFVIPFEKNKSEFKQEDIKPFIDALQEPDFIIDGLFIYAYSSIEGDSVANTKLQRKRAESVTKVLQSMQTSKITPTIITSDSWNLFQLEMEDGKYDYLTKMSKKEAIRTINKGGLAQELEPYLSKERFAQIIMDVTYDISGNKEQRFALVSFNRAVKSGNNKQAYKIMDFINKKVNSDKYSKDIWDNMEIPYEAKYSGILMNKVYYDYIDHGHLVDEDQWAEIKKLEALDPSNNIIKFNSLLCKVQLDTTFAANKNEQLALQTNIDALYKTEIPHNIVNALNVEYQFKLMEALDTVDGAEAQIEAIINKIKGFYNFTDGSWQNALKLAYAFCRAKDYKFASAIVEPYIFPERQKTPMKMSQLPLGDDLEKVLFAYISMASHVPEKFFSRNFSDALVQAREMNKERYCKLFGAPYMSFQVLDNPKVKKDYFETGCAK